jgi:hypothetical protein
LDSQQLVARLIENPSPPEARPEGTKQEPSNVDRRYTL